MNNENNIPAPNGQAPNGADPTSQALASNGQAPNETPNNTSHEDLLRQIKELRAENASHRKKAQEQTQAAQAAEQARLAEQGQYKQLAEQHETRLKELEPVAARYEALAEQIHAQIESQVKDWPAELKMLVPDKNTPVDERLARVEQLKPLLEKLMQQARSGQPGNGPNPKPSGGNTPEELSKAFEQRMRASGKYHV